MFWWSLAIVGALAAWEVIKFLRKPSKAIPPTSARPGKAPYPMAAFVDLPGGKLRLIDTRAFPLDALKVGRLDVIQEQLLLARPIQMQIWVVDVTVARAWSELSDVARVVVSGHVRDLRSSNGQNLIYPVGGTLSDDEGARLKAVGLEVVLSMTNLSDPPKQIEDFLEPPQVWSRSREDRPVPAYDVISADPFDGKLIHVIQGFACVDLRRVHPEAWQTGAALQRLEKLVPAIEKAPEASHVVCVVAPWVLELIDDAAAKRVEELVTSLPTRLEKRLAVVASSGEPLADYPLTSRLKPKLGPLRETLIWSLKKRGTFEVQPIDALHDAYFRKLWAAKEPASEDAPGAPG